MLFFACRKRGAIGIATDYCMAPTYEDLADFAPDLEVLAVFNDRHEMDQYAISDKMLAIQDQWTSA